MEVECRAAVRPRAAAAKEFWKGVQSEGRHGVDQILSSCENSIRGPAGSRPERLRRRTETRWGGRENA
eukprot:1742509-Rhodomonas_salina.1